jgi:hypothetical protein
MTVHFIIQGPTTGNENIIKKNIKLIFSYYPKACIAIQSTCINEELSSFFSDQPDVNYRYLKDVGSYKKTRSTRNQYPNLNRQIFSSILRDRPKFDVTVKIRADLEIKSLYFIQKSIKYIAKKPTRVGIVAITTTGIRDMSYGLYHVCDWVYIMNTTLYQKVFNQANSLCEQKLYQPDGSMTFASESFITREILLCLKYCDLATHQFDANFAAIWARQYNEVFFMIPYLSTFRSSKYPRILGNLRNSHLYGLDLRSTLRLIFS